MQVAFENLPWKVEAHPEVLAVIDAKGLVVAEFTTDAMDLEDAGLSPQEQVRRAYSTAGAPRVYAAARAFLDGLSTPPTCFDEEALLRLSNDLEEALLAAKPPMEIAQ